MYDKLVKRLWECASGECFNCSQYMPTTNASVCQKELMKQAADAIEELSKHRWIPVAERLPSGRVEVLVSSGIFAPLIEVAFYDGLFYSAWDGETEIVAVTHWMPLPQPPKEA